jgi:hypothetical protein
MGESYVEVRDRLRAQGMGVLCAFDLKSENPHTPDLFMFPATGLKLRCGADFFDAIVGCVDLSQQTS